MVTIHTMLHHSSVERFIEISTRKLWHTSSFLLESLISKCNFWKNSLSPFWGPQGRWGQTTSKPKTTKILNENSLEIDEIQNLASATSKIASWPQKGLSEFYITLHFWNQCVPTKKMRYVTAFLSKCSLHRGGVAQIVVQVI